MDWLIRTAKIIRLRLLQVAMQDAENVGNMDAVRRIAPNEAMLRAELEAL